MARRRYLLNRGTSSVCGVQLKQEQHQDPQETGGAQSLHQLDQHRQSTVVGHVRKCISEHVYNPRGNGVHVSRGILREMAGLKTQVIYLTNIVKYKRPFVHQQISDLIKEEVKYADILFVGLT